MQNCQWKYRNKNRGIKNKQGGYLRPVLHFVFAGVQNFEPLL
jgi:hypothetical protein